MGGLNVFTQSDLDYQFASDPASAGDVGAVAGLFAFFAAYMLFVLVIVVLAVIGLWKVFEKAGKPGWAAIIPIYNVYILLQIIGRPVWWIVIPFVSFIPVIGPLLVLAWSLVVAMDLGKSFGKDTGFSILALWLFSIVGYLMLGFGKDKYLGPKQSVLPQMVAPGVGSSSKTPPPPAN